MLDHDVQMLRLDVRIQHLWGTGRPHRLTSHALGHTLHVTDGLGPVQCRGGKVIEIRPGDTIYTPPMQWHWHGATPDHFMVHLAMCEAPAPDSAVREAAWGDLVTDEECSKR
jgi:quercetin dioxygenase-like cupin family protein